MKKKLGIITLLAACMIIAVAFFVDFYTEDTKTVRKETTYLLDLNEIQKLGEQGEYEQQQKKLEMLMKELRLQKEMPKTGKSSDTGAVGKMAVICLAFLFFVSGYVYIAILEPFEKMKKFAGEIAKGNFDIPLQYERSNYFGEFTWSFDCMRREIVKARLCEREAIENNKTVIATLSHDIKTPIASIRAYAEGLEVNLDATPQKRARYLNVLMKKCDEVSRLTNDLFLHSISDLEKLKVSPEKTELCAFMEQAVEEMAAEKQDVVFEKGAEEIFVLIDRSRMLQITENLINNARKYAKTGICIKIRREEELVKISFWDSGAGIPAEDLPFIFDKFYRGKNCGSEQGSGLGLYIVKYLMEQMNGAVMLYNHADGLEVELSLPMEEKKIP